MKLHILKTNRKCPVSIWMVSPDIQREAGILCWPIPENSRPVVHTGTTKRKDTWAEFLNSEPLEDWTAFENRVNRKSKSYTNKISWWFRLWKK